jgi:hypothetical protein
VLAIDPPPHESQNSDPMPTAEASTTLVVTVPEAGMLLGIGSSLAWKLAAEGVIPTLKLARRVVVPRRAIDLLLEAALEGWSPAEAARRLARARPV